MNELTYEEKQYNLATTNFYLVAKNSLVEDIKKAVFKMEEEPMEDILEDQQAKLNYYSGVLAQAQQTLLYIESVYRQSIIEQRNKNY